MIFPYLNFFSIVQLDVCSDSIHLCVPVNYPFLAYYYGNLDVVQLTQLITNAVQAQIGNIQNADGLSGIAVSTVEAQKDATVNSNNATTDSASHTNNEKGNNKNEKDKNETIKDVTINDLFTSIFSGTNVTNTTTTQSETDTSTTGSDSNTNDNNGSDEEGGRDRAVVGAIEMPSSGDSGPGAGTIVGVSLAGALVVLLALVLLHRRRQVGRDVVPVTDVKHKAFLNDDDDEEYYEEDDDDYLRNNTSANTSPETPVSTQSRSSQESRVVARILNDEESGNDYPVEASLNPSARLSLASPPPSTDEDDPHHSCCSPSCQQCERKRQQANVQFIRSDSTSTSRLPNHASRHYVANDTVDL
jgi:hypothetical protein